MATIAKRTAKSYEKNKHKLLVIGGNGFVGSNILQRAVQKGIYVRSLNRSGKPKWNDVPWVNEVDWIEGDVFKEEDITKAVKGITGVSKLHFIHYPIVVLFENNVELVSTVGAFGSNEIMEKMCGDATIQAANVAQKVGKSHHSTT